MHADGVAFDPEDEDEDVDLRATSTCMSLEKPASSVQVHAADPSWILYSTTIQDLLYLV